MKKIISFILAVFMLLPVLSVSAEERTTFALEGKSYYEIDNSVRFTLTVGDGFENADIYLDDYLIHSIQGSGVADEIGGTLDISSAPYLGEVTITAKAYYGNSCDEVSEKVVITRLSEPTTSYSENFTGYNTGTAIRSFIGTNNAGSFDKYSYGESDIAVKIVLPGKVTSNAPFMRKEGLTVAKGSLISVKFDAYFSTSTGYLYFETRDFSGDKYPQNGESTMATVKVFSSGGLIDGGKSFEKETWYSVKLDMNMLSKGLEVYVKGGEFEDYTLQNSYPEYTSDGLSQIRFTGYESGTEGGFIAVDNVEIIENKEAPQWYAKMSYEDADGSEISSAPVSGGKINLNFSRDMGEIANNTIKLYNASGDEIAFTGTYDADNYIYSIAPSTQLLYNTDHYISFAEGTRSVDKQDRLSEVDLLFKTSKYNIKVSEVEVMDGEATITVENFAAVNGEEMAVCAFDESGNMIDFNYFSLTADLSAYNVTLPSTTATSKLIIYIFGPTSSPDVYEIFTR